MAVAGDLVAALMGFADIVRVEHAMAFSIHAGELHARVIGSPRAEFLEDTTARNESGLGKIIERERNNAAFDRDPAKIGPGEAAHKFREISVNSSSANHGMDMAISVLSVQASFVRRRSERIGPDICFVRTRNSPSIFCARVAVMSQQKKPHALSQH